MRPVRESVKAVNLRTTTSVAPQLTRPSTPCASGRRRDPVTAENEQLRKENARLRRHLEQAQTILEIQKKASELLGIPLNPPPSDDDE